MIHNNLSQSGSTELTQILAEMNGSGKFPVSVLTDQHGLSIASAAVSDQDTDTQSALVALIQQTVSQASYQLGLTQTDEISLFDASGRRLVCRPFEANGHHMILAVIVPNKTQSYRRLTNKAVTTIRRQWKL